MSKGNTTGAFLVSPGKGPLQPIEIQNLSSHAEKFTLTPVATSYSSGHCLPTSVKVPWFKVSESAEVYAHKTLSLPVSVAGAPSGTIDVAVKISPMSASHGVGVAYSAYAQEIVGPMSQGVGCAVLHGVKTAPHTASVGHATPLPVVPIGVGSVVVLAACVACVRVFRPRHGYRGGHR
jgi:hypothetical protein